MIIGQFQWMQPLAPMMWNFTCSHWWCLMHIALECQLHGSLQVTKHAMIWWLTPLKKNFLRKNPKWKPSCFIIDDAPQELQVWRWVLFSFYLFLSFYVRATISKFHPTFSIVNNVISWNDNKLVFYAWLGSCGVTIKCPFTFAHDTS